MRISPLGQLEMKLVPVDTDGLAALDRIWQCTHLGDLPVVHRDDITHWDRYYDTPTFALWLRRGYLRLRTEEGERGRELVTYRRARRGAEPPFEVLEVTMPSGDLPHITRQLVQDTGDIAMPAPGAIGAPEVLASMGMEEVLRIRTRRRRMRLEMLPGSHSQVKLDVSHFDDASVPYVEIEVEVTAPHETGDLAKPALADLLQLLHGERWVVSYASKLEIGLGRRESQSRGYPALGEPL